MTIRVGFGFDVHEFAVDRPLILGGVNIPHTHGLAGHSDADALLHAVTDALLGAAGMGDIGHHFPDSDAAYKNHDSRIFLRDIHRKIQQQRLAIANIDATIVAQVPKMSPHRRQMERNIAEDLLLSSDRVNVKATTTESLGFIGRKEGVAVWAVTLLTTAQ